MTRMMCYLALAREATPTLQAFDAKFKELFPNLSGSPTAKSDFSNRDVAHTLNLFSLCGLQIVVLSVAAPLPFEEWDFPVRQSMLGEPAHKMMQQHAAHLVVTTITEPSSPDEARHHARIVTAVAITLGHLTPALAAIWAPGRCFNPIDRFAAAAREIDAGQPAITLWTGMLFGMGKPTADGLQTNGAMTTGLVPFFGREIEIEPAAIPMMTIAQRLLGVIQYLFMQGPVLKDGDTLGISETERIRVVHMPETVRLGVPVTKLTIESLDRKGGPRTAFPVSAETPSPTFEKRKS